MIHVSYHCDICDKVLPLERRRTSIGEIEIVKTGKTKICDTRGLFQHLCVECALNIDKQLLQAKLDILENRSGKNK